MKIITRPSVHLVAQQEVNSIPCAEFLEAHGVEYWNTDTDNAGEQLAEIARRRCAVAAHVHAALRRPAAGEGAVAAAAEPHLLPAVHPSTCYHHYLYVYIYVYVCMYVCMYVYVY